LRFRKGLDKTQKKNENASMQILVPLLSE